MIFVYHKLLNAGSRFELINLEGYLASNSNVHTSQIGVLGTIETYVVGTQV